VPGAYLTCRNLWLQRRLYLLELAIVGSTCTECGKRRKLFVPDNTWGQALCRPCFDKFVVSRTRRSKSGRKRCPYCEKWKPLTEFKIDYARGYFSSYCAPCDKITSENYRDRGSRTMTAEKEASFWRAFALAHAKNERQSKRKRTK